MRLKEGEIEFIKEIFENFLGSHMSSVYLFGSRTDDKQKGGDIDLLLVTSSDEKGDALAKRMDIIVQLKKRLGDQKIDVVIKSRDELNFDPFCLSIKDSLVRIL